MIFNYRFLARIIVEAVTPVVVKSGEKNILTDGAVLRDVNDLPYIPGTSIAGVLRHAWKDEKIDVDTILGFQHGDKGEGSKLIFSEARMLGSGGRVIDGLQDINDDSFLKNYKQLPIRQHVRITDRGVAADKGKFDEEIVYAGTRFCFELEMLSKEDIESFFDELLATLQSHTFRLGSGTRNGFGEIKVVSLWKRVLNLQDKEDLEAYLSKSSNLEASKGWYTEKVNLVSKETEWTSYELQLMPSDFFLFGSGFGDDEADMTPVKEQRVLWNGESAQLGEYSYLVPASSVKGAIAHRVAFHYNKLKGIYADLLSDEEKKNVIGKNNDAVKSLFGSEGDEKGDGKLRGNVLFSALYLEYLSYKLLNHVAIDRFTGGAIDGALFTEKVTYGNGQGYALKIFVNSLSIENDVMKALELALDDICKGMLPLGGGVNRGHGTFSGVILKNGEELCVER